MKNTIPEKIVYICSGSKCNKKGSKDLFKKLKSHLKKSGIKDVELIKTECTDRCKLAPVLSLQPKNEWLMEYEEKSVFDKIIREINGKD